jgi:hypothetical protein
MDLAALIAKMDEQRARWVSLPDGKRVQIRRPLETNFVKFRAGINVEHLCEYACGWDGFTEADLLGASVGASDAVEFDAELWGRVLRDRIAYVQPLASAMIEAITEHLDAKAAAAKN